MRQLPAATEQVLRGADVHHRQRPPPARQCRRAAGRATAGPPAVARASDACACQQRPARPGSGTRCRARTAQSGCSASACGTGISAGATAAMTSIHPTTRTGLAAAVRVRAASVLLAPGWPAPRWGGPPPARTGLRQTATHRAQLGVGLALTERTALEKPLQGRGVDRVAQRGQRHAQHDCHHGCGVAPGVLAQLTARKGGNQRRRSCGLPEQPGAVVATELSAVGRCQRGSSAAA